MRHQNSFSIGDVIRIGERGGSLIVEKIDPMGSFLKVIGKSAESSNKVVRLLNPKTCNVMISKNGEFFPADCPDPEELSKQQVIELDNIEPGKILEVRDRLWRIDGIDIDKKVVKVSFHSS